MNNYRNQDFEIFATSTDYSDYGSKNDVSDTIQYGNNIVLTQDSGIAIDVYFKEIGPGSITDNLKIDFYKKRINQFESPKEKAVRTENLGNEGNAAGEIIKHFDLMFWIDGPGIYLPGVYADGGTDNFSCRIVGRFF